MLGDPFGAIPGRRSLGESVKQINTKSWDLPLPAILPLDRPGSAKPTVIERELGITFGGTDTAPFVEAMATAAPETAAIGDTIRLIGSSSCGETYQWQQIGGPTVTLDSANQPDTEFTVIDGGDEPFRFRLTVRGPGGLEDSAEVTINRIPIANAGPDQIVRPGQLVTLDASASHDPDGEELSYRWTRIAGPAVALSDDTAVSPTFTVPSSARSLRFRVTVRDGQGNTDTDAVRIRVNRTLIADAGPDQTVATGAAVTLDGSGTRGPQQSTIVYVWSQIRGPSVTLNDRTSTMPRFVAPNKPTTIKFRLTVTDLQRNRSTDTVTITVDGNTPIADAGLDQEVAHGATVTLDGSGQFCRKRQSDLQLAGDKPARHHALRRHHHQSHLRRTE